MEYNTSKQELWREAKLLSESAQKNIEFLQKSAGTIDHKEIFELLDRMQKCLERRPQAESSTPESVPRDFKNLQAKYNNLLQLQSEEVQGKLLEKEVELIRKFGTEIPPGGLFSGQTFPQKSGSQETTDPQASANNFVYRCT